MQVSKFFILEYPGLIMYDRNLKVCYLNSVGTKTCQKGIAQPTFTCETFQNLPSPQNIIFWGF